MQIIFGGNIREIELPYGGGIDNKMTLDTEKFLHYDISGEMYKLYGEPYLQRYRNR